MPLVYCPHCLEQVQLQEPVEGSSQRCPVCARTIGAVNEEEEVQKEYEMHQTEKKPKQTKEVRDYIDSLEKTARRRSRKITHRPARSVNLWAGYFLISSGILLCGYVFMRGGGLLTMFLLGILFPIGLILIGAAFIMTRNN